MDRVRFSLIQDDQSDWEIERRKDSLLGPSISIESVDDDDEVDDDNNDDDDDDNDDDNDDDDDDDADKKTISSESSCEGLPNMEKGPNENQNQAVDCDVWQRFEGDGDALHELPNADKVLEMLNNGNWEDTVYDSECVNTAILLAVLLERNECIITLLNSFYANVNFADKKGRTALHLACSKGNVSIAKILIDRGANVRQWDNEKKLTPLHCAAGASSPECVKLLIESGACVNAGIEKRSALHLAIEKKAIECVELLLKSGANPNTPQVYTETPLHTAASFGHVECMQLLLNYGADVRSQFGRRRLTALHLAAEDDYVDCVKLLLEHDAEVDARDVDDKTPLHLACLSQCSESVDVLIKYGADVNTTYKDLRTALHAAIVKESRCLDCTRSLLEAGADPNRADIFGYTPLHMAALNENSPCAYLLLEHGADITARTMGGVTALTFIVRRVPEVIPKFLVKFDESVTVNDHEIGDVDCEIKLDFHILVPNMESSESGLLLAFIEVGKKRILKHPLCETFLFLKWRRIRKFFLIGVCFQAVYVLLFSTLIWAVYGQPCQEKDEKTGEMVQKDCSVPSYIVPVGHSVNFLNTILLAKEFFQIGHGFYNYIRFWENWVQWVIIFGVYLCATPSAFITNNLNTLEEWQYHVAAIIIFLVWVELMMLVGRFPIFGLYVQMFTKVAVNFASFLLAYCCLLVAFALSFGVLFSTYRPFQSLPWTLLKTITMMSGELEYEDIFYGDTEIRYPVTSHCMFFTFVLLVTIILTNLLVGLAVSDIQGLQASAGLDRLSRQADLVARLEAIFFSKLLSNAPRKFIRMCQRSALLRTSAHHLQFCVRPNDPRDTRLPRDLVIDVYKLVAERKQRAQSVKRRKRENNFSIFTNTITNEQTKARNYTCSVNFDEPVQTDILRKKVNVKSQVRVPTDFAKENTKIDKQLAELKKQLSEVTCRVIEMHTLFSKHSDDLRRELNFIKLKLDRSS